MAKEEKKGRPRRPTAAKRDIRNAKRQEINRTFKSKVRTAMRRLETDRKEGDRAIISESIKQVYSLVDQAVKRGIYKPNKAARVKSRASILPAPAK